MKRIVLAVFISLYFFTTHAQQSRIENTRVRLSTSQDSLIVNYNLTGKRKAFDVKLHVNSPDGQTFMLNNVNGDIGNGIHPGTNKTIIWNIKEDKADVYGIKLQVKVTGKVFEPLKIKKETWIPWLYIAAGASTATGVYAQIRAKQIYRDYPPSSITDEAEKLHKDVEQMHKLRNIAFGTAGALGIAGVAVHLKHIQKKKAVDISYLPLNEGAAIGLNIKF